MNPHAWLNWLSGTFTWVLRTTWQASLLAILVLGAQWILRRHLSAKTRYLLWGVVVLRLVMPPLPQTRWTLFARFLPGETVKTMDHAEATPPLVEPAPVPVPPAPSETRGSTVIDPAQVAELRAELAAMSAVESSSPETLPASAPPRQTLKRPPFRWTWPKLTPLLLILWTVGFAALIIRLFIASFSLSRSIRRCPAWNDESIQSLARACAAEAGLRYVPRVLAADHLPGPAVTGFFSPKLLLPRGLVASFSTAELRLMLLHEFAHLRRRDLQLNWLLTVLQSVHWFNPLLRYALNHLRADCELACDEFVLKTRCSSTPEGLEQTYGHALLRLAQKLSRRPASSLTLASLGPIGLLDGPQHLHRRITMIAQFNSASRPLSRTWPAVFAGGLLLSAGVLLADAGDPFTPTPSEKPPEAPKEQLDQDRRQRGDPNFVLDKKADIAVWSTAVATEDSKGMTPAVTGDSLESLALSTARLRVKVAEVNLRTKKAAHQRVKSIHEQVGGNDAEYEQTVADVELAQLSLEQEQLDLRKAELQMAQAGVGRTMDYIRTMQQQKAVDEKAEAINKLSAIQHEKKVVDEKAGTIDKLQLRLIQPPQLRGNVIVEAGEAGPRVHYSGMGTAIDPAKNSESPAAFTEIQDDVGRKVDTAMFEKLHKPLVGDFSSIAVPEAITFIADKAGVDLIFDHEAIKGAGGSLEHVANFKVNQPTAGDQLLRWVLRETPAVDFTVDHGVLLISSRAKIERMTTTRVYQTENLGGLTDELPQLMQEVVAPGSWQMSGGPGSVRLFGSKLLVTQTAANHAEVEKLLKLLSTKSMMPGPRLGGGMGGRIGGGPDEGGRMSGGGPGQLVPPAKPGAILPPPFTILTAPLDAARNRAAMQESVSHMRQILMAVHLYAADHNGELPRNLREDVNPYLDGKADAMFTNPRAPLQKEGYTYIRAADRLSDLRSASDAVILYEAVDAGSGGIGVGYADGHVATVKDSEELSRQIKALRAPVPN